MGMWQLRCLWTEVYVDCGVFVYVATLCYVICYVATLGTLNRGTWGLWCMWTEVYLD